MTWKKPLNDHFRFLWLSSRMKIQKRMKKTMDFRILMQRRDRRRLLEPGLLEPWCRIPMLRRQCPRSRFRGWLTKLNLKFLKVRSIELRNFQTKRRRKMGRTICVHGASRCPGHGFKDADSNSPPVSVKPSICVFSQ